MYPLPSNGWRPGMATNLAARSGPFRAALTNGKARAWLGGGGEPMSWPAGWRVRFDPVELIDASGEVFAREGDPLMGAGGVDNRGVFGLTQIEKLPEHDGSAPPPPDEWFAQLADATKQRLIDDPAQQVPTDLVPDVRGGSPSPSRQVVPDRTVMGEQGPLMLALHYPQYVKLTALYVQYIRAMERRHAARHEIRPPQHRLGADPIAALDAVDRDPSETWSDYEHLVTVLRPAR